MTALVPPPDRRLLPGQDRYARSVWLGVQARDAVTGQVVHDGLLMEVDRPDQPWRRPLRLAAGPSGVHALHDADGTRGTASPPALLRLRVHDRHARYLDSCLLLPEGSDDPPPAGPVRTLPLYSAATRVPPPGLACVYLSLRTGAAGDQPAPWVRLALSCDGERLAEGLADANGQALLLLPLPRPPAPVLGASPAVADRSDGWTVTLQAWHDPALRAHTLPDLATLLAQPSARLLDSLSPQRLLPPQTLRAGAPLVVRSTASSYVHVAP